jgi:ABC-type oligopeptide transport system substrate-binding subunit/DNA-binding SARP family transcriptional activator
MLHRSGTERAAEANTPSLSVYMLGPPAVEQPGSSLTISRRQVRAILYYLASQRRLVPRENLGFLFWPDTRESTARRNLTRLLTHLRHALPLPQLLVTSGDCVGLDPQDTWSDTAAFRRLCTPQSTDHEFKGLKRAIDLYQGPFLAGFSLPGCAEFETWATLEREAWQRLYLETLRGLIAQCAAGQDYNAAIYYAGRYLATDDLAEDIHRRLIEIYATVGDRNAALQQFEKCTVVLERELGVSPLPETQAVYRAILTGQAPPRRQETPSLSWSTLPSLETPLVGRDHELDRLRRAYLDARARHGKVVLISGEPGVGKSRLMQDFVTKEQDRGMSIVGGGYEGEDTLPYWVLVEALRPHLPAIDWATLRIAPSYLAEIARLLPTVQDSLRDLPEPISYQSEPQPSRLFQALTGLFLKLAEKRAPLVLCLDDLQWADKATLSWLGHLGRRIGDTPILVLGAYRTEQAGAIASLRTGLSRASVLEELKLDELEESDVLHLIRNMSGQSSGAEMFSRRLHWETGGNPFFLLETLRAMFAGGILWEDETGWSTDIDDTTESYEELPIPDTVQEAIRVRLDRLDVESRQILEAASVVGHQFTLELVRDTSGRREGQVVDALDTLLTQQLISERDAEYRFNHDLVRGIVYQGLGHGRRQLLHRRAAEALELLQSDDVASLAWHFERAGGEQLLKAVDYLLQAGDRAHRLYAHSEATEFYQRALAHLKNQGESQRAARILMKLGLIYHITFDFRRAHQAFEEGFALWQRPPPVRQTVLPTVSRPLKVDWVEPTTLDPTMAGDVPSAGVVDQLFSGLVELGPDLDVVPAVARTWEVMEGGHTYVFHLRGGVRWSDGMPVTAHDFAYAWKRILNPQTDSPSAGLMYGIKGASDFCQGKTRDPDSLGVHVLDEVTLIVELEDPIGFFPHLLACCAAYPIPRHVVEACGETWSEAEHIVTNGPFRLEAWQQGQVMRLARNATYSGPRAGNVRQITLSLSSDGLAKAESYEMDDLDVLDIGNLPGPERDRMRLQHAGEYVSVPRLHTLYIGFDVSRPPFRDIRIRRAFVLAIDREMLAGVVKSGYVSPATGGFLPPGMLGHAGDAGLPFDPDRARLLMAEAGYPAGQGFPAVEVLTFRPAALEGEYLQEQWQENLGVTIGWRRLSIEAFLSTVEKEPPHMFLSGNLADYPDPDDFLRASPHTRRTGWHNETYTKLVERARCITDHVQRIEMYAEADRILVREAAVMPLIYGRLNLLVKPWVEAYPTSATKQWFWKDVVLARRRMATTRRLDK